jgi:predicted RND superfamily exporter protein
LLAYLWLNQPPALFGELTRRLAPANLANTLQETRERLATSLSPDDLALGGYDPYGLTRLPDAVARDAPALGAGEEMFASPDGKFRLIFIEARPDLAGYRECRSWMADVRRLIAQARASGQLPDQVVVRATGRPAFVAEISTSMEQDMGGTSAGTLGVIALLFWLTHRRLRPLCWLLALLLAILAGALALGGLCLGAINVVSMGFAAILLGLAEDFGIVIYQESRSHPELTARELRREAAPGICWSAVTTAGAFLMLNLSVLPGLGQLGSLVAIGIVLAAVVMLYGYTPLVLRFRAAADRLPPAPHQERLLLFQPVKLLPPQAVWTITLLLLALAAGLLWHEGLRIDHSPDPLKPKHSQAYAALDQIKTRLGRAEEPLWVVVPGRNETEVGRRLDEAETVLRRGMSNGLIAGFMLPQALWPQPGNQQANRAALPPLLADRELLRRAALNAGFATNALFTTDKILDTWQRAAASTHVFWPTNRASRWLLAKATARSADGFLALGMVQPAASPAATKQFAAQWPRELQRQGVLLSGWNLLGWAVFDLVVRELPRVVIPVFVLVVVSLWLAFRRLKEVLLSLATLAFSAVLLAGTMDVLGWEWNLINVMSLPLLLGMGVDFSIHIQLALKRCHGDRLLVRQSVGRALLLAGATTVAGFGSLAFSSNAGMASLGLVCALGITLSLLVAVYLLPVWWQAWGMTTNSILLSR